MSDGFNNDKKEGELITKSLYFVNFIHALSV